VAIFSMEVSSNCNGTELEESALNPRRYHVPYRNINYQGVVTAQWWSWGRPNTPPDRPLSPPEPLGCPLGPWSA
jgi:hypothetical protein